MIVLSGTRFSAPFLLLILLLLVLIPLFADSDVVELVVFDGRDFRGLAGSK